MRLAWFTPWPPQATGVAGRSVDVTRTLADRGHAIDVFVDRKLVPGATRCAADPPTPGEVRVQSAHDFVWRHHRQQFDLIVYQLGNSAAHGFLWPYLLRYPGLTIFHDAHLHHSRGAQLITPASAAAYRSAFAADHPDVRVDTAELAIAGFDGAYYYLWPMTSTAFRASRAAGVHARGCVDGLQSAHPDIPIRYVALGMGRERIATEEERRRTRTRFGLPEDAIIFGAFGGLTADKRVPVILDAFRRLLRLTRRVHLLLAGRPDPALNLHDAVAAAPSGSVTLRSDLDDDAFEAAVAAVDVSLNLRWPTARETSGPWVQAIAAARPTITLDLAHAAHVPALDPQTWTPRQGGNAERPVTVALDILDEAHSLDLAMARLATDSALRARLGAAARSWWEREHTVGRMADDYEHVMQVAVARPSEPVDVPAALRPDPMAQTLALIRPYGDLTCTLF